MKTIYYNAKVYTGDMPFAEAFAVEDGKFVFAGSNAQAREIAAAGDCMTDLGGRFVCPGFTDSHMHIVSYGNSLTTAQLDRHTSGIGDMIAYFRDFAQEHPPKDGGWIVGRGWNQDYFTDISRMPNRWDLDMVSAEYPVLAARCCGHAIAVNSKALDILGVTADTFCPEGGGIGMENGVPNGVFLDNAMDIVYSAIPAPDKDAIKDMIRVSCRALNAFGITACHTDDFASFTGIDWKVVDAAIRELEAAGELSVRIYEQSNFSDIDTLREFCESGHITGVGSDMYKIGPLKLLGDGALGAHTAFLSRPYADDPDNFGLPVFSQETLDLMIGYAHEKGMQCAVHAIGDACLDRVLSAYARALAAHPRSDHRHGIVHCQITRPDQLQKIIDMGLHVYAQTIFIDYDSRIVRQRVGNELAETSYNWKTLMKAGVSVSNGTDCPVESPSALRGIQCAITRKSLDGDGEVYLPHEAFTVQEALDSYTIRSAEASFDENKKGRIRPGMLADFVVLDEDPFRAAPDAIKDITVHATYLGGKKVFG